MFIHMFKNIFDSIKTLRKNHFEIQDGLFMATIGYSTHGDLDGIKSIFTSLKFKKYVDMKLLTNECLKWASQKGHLDIVKYLLTSSDLINNPDIHTNNDLAFRLACSYGHLDIVKYLLTSPELKEHANVHADKDYGFEWICFYGHQAIIEYLIFDYKIEQTKDIKHYLIENNKQDIINMFEKHNFKEKLQINLHNKTKNNEKLKI